MVVGREIDCGKGDVTEETCGCALVETDETEVLNDPEGRTAGNAFHIFGDLSLNLETNLDDFEGARGGVLALGTLVTGVLWIISTRCQHSRA